MQRHIIYNINEPKVLTFITAQVVKSLFWSCREALSKMPRKITAPQKLEITKSLRAWGGNLEHAIIETQGSVTAAVGMDVLVGR